MSRVLRAALVAGIPYLWLLAFFLVPFLIVLKISLSEVATAIPPYRPVFDGLAGLPDRLGALSLDNYRFLAGDPLYVDAYLSSLRIAAVATLLTLLLGYPIAYAVARAGGQARRVLLALVILPFWTSFLIRVYALVAILKPEGLLNQALAPLGLGPFALLNTEGAVILGIVYSYLPFMILPLYASLERLDPSLLEAAADLGARPVSAFLRVTLPLSWPGIVAGSLLVFIPAVGEFVIPDLLGGSGTLMIGKTLWDEFFINRDWPLASAVAVLLLLVLVVPLAAIERARAQGRRA